MDLDDLEVYRLSMELGDEVWEIVKDWDYFQRDTLGKQLIRAVDSIAANLSEGFGRYYFKENKQFCYYSRGSLYETRTFLTKAHRRGFIDESTFSSWTQKLDLLAVKLNNYINSIGKTKHQNDTRDGK